MNRDVRYRRRCSEGVLLIFVQAVAVLLDEVKVVPAAREEERKGVPAGVCYSSRLVPRSISSTKKTHWCFIYRHYNSRSYQGGGLSSCRSSHSSTRGCICQLPTITQSRKRDESIEFPVPRDVGLDLHHSQLPNINPACKHSPPKSILPLFQRAVFKLSHLDRPIGYKCLVCALFSPL